MKQPELYERFRVLHEGKGGFIMPNAWDAVSALLLKQAGFEALGTSSAAVASALGRLDGRHAISREEHLANAQLIGGITTLPVNGDFEDGYGADARDVTFSRAARILTIPFGVWWPLLTSERTYSMRPSSLTWMRSEPL